MSTGRPTMEDVAARAGVSRALVSIVFRDVPGASEATRARVLAAAAELGYEPDRRASRLGRSRTRMVGVVFTFGGDFHAEVIDGIYAAADQHGYEIVLSAATTRRSEAAAIRAILAERCEGVILIGPQLPTAQIAALATRAPTVVLLRHLRLTTVDVVRTDEKAAMGLLIEHLTGLGHERILHLDGGPAAGAAQRRQGYHAAMTNHGLIPQTLPSGLSEESGARAADTLLQRTPGSRPTAVAAFNDHCALGVLHRLRGSSLHIPDDLSLTGFDDIPAAGYRHIDLTTIRQDADHIGHHAIQRLRDRLDDHQSPALPYLVPPSLIIRRTTAPPT
jgi:DNA-binding LacI/PurR family transcriptional regulator